MGAIPQIFRGPLGSLGQPIKLFIREESLKRVVLGLACHFLAVFPPLLSFSRSPFSSAGTSGNPVSPSNDIITSQHAAEIVREMAKAGTTIPTWKTLISGVLLINSSGLMLGGMITIKCLITNLYVMMHFNYFGLVHYYWAFFPSFLAPDPCRKQEATPTMPGAPQLFTWRWEASRDDG